MSRRVFGLHELNDKINGVLRSALRGERPNDMGNIMKFSKVFWLSVLIAMVAGLSACGGSDNDDNSNPGITDTDSDGVADAEDNCPEDANSNQVDSDADGEGDVCDPIPSTYTYTNSDGEDTVSYTGQIKRHILIEDMVDTMASLVEGGVPTGEAPNPDVVGALNFFFRFDGATSDSLESTYAIAEENLLPGGEPTFTYGAVSSGKSLVEKIAGGDGEGAGETTRLIDGEFFGWSEGLELDPLPVDLVDYFFSQLENEATDNVTPMIPVGDTTVALNTVTVDAYGRDYRQLIQKFLLGAVTFSQATNDYLQTDFASTLARVDGEAYSTAEHHWDEGFGYFGAARNYNDYTDDEIAAAGGRVEYSGSYHDTNGDGLIDVRSEVNLGNSTNCGKRDRATASNPNPTNFSKEAFDAFLIGREILKNASASGELTAAAQAALDTQIEIAALSWEKCIAATVIHYINDTIGDMENFDTVNNSFADLENFTNLAKHWSEMKGFALGLQFSPVSPFRESTSATNDLREVLSLMGDAPVLADGTQAGVDFAGGVDAYEADLLEAREILEEAYDFDTTNVQNW